MQDDGEYSRRRPEALTTHEQRDQYDKDVADRRLQRLQSYRREEGDAESGESAGDSYRNRRQIAEPEIVVTGADSISLQRMRLKAEDDEEEDEEVQY